MKYSLEGQVAVITGGAGGIGAAIALEMWEQGASVAIVDIIPSDEAVFSNPRGLQRLGVWVADVTKTEEVEAFFAQVTEQLGPVTTVVNNVGGCGTARCTGIEDITDEDWDLVLALNLGSVMRLSRSAVPGMKQRGFGRIINIGSGLMRGMFSNPGTVDALLPYATGKSGIEGLTRQLAFDLARLGITVNAVIPGITFPGENSRITKRFKALPAEEQARLMAPIPVGRPGTGEDIAHMVCFLATPAASYITGELVNVSGGFLPS